MLNTLAALWRIPSGPLQMALSRLILRGAIREISAVAPFPDEPQFPQYTTQVLAPAGELVWANGIGATPEEALVKTIGEAIERYALGAYRGDQCPVSKYGGLQPALDPQSVTGPSPSQRNAPGWEEWRITRDSPFCWARGVSLVSGQETWIPAQLVYKPYARAAGEPILRLPITNGAAAALSRDEAIVHGIAEIIEREAFMVTYLNRLAPPRVELPRDRSPLGSVAAAFARCGLELAVYALPTDMPLAVMLAVITDRSGRGPAISVGAKADFDSRVAASGAILEASHTRIAVRRLLEAGAERIPSDRAEVIRPTDHALFWSPRSRIGDFEFLSHGRAIELPEDAEVMGPSAKLERLLAALREKRLDAFWVDLAPPSFRSAGVVTGKAIIPGLHPLYVDERYPYYGGMRLCQLPVALGYRKTPRDERELNPLPHPFP